MKPDTTFIDTLRAKGHVVLADALDRTHSRTPYEHSENIWSYRPKRDIDPLLKQALYNECVRCGYEEKEAERTIETCATYRTIQTSAHTEIAPPPRRFCIDWISTRATPQDAIYIICAFSGVPFSNKSRPGRITHNEVTYNFIPKTYQDALAYHMPIFDKMVRTYESLPAELIAHIPHPETYTTFTTWASASASALISKATQCTTRVLDINAIASDYIIAALDDPDHIITRMLLDPQTTQSILNAFGENTHFFYSPYETGKYTKQENLYYLDGYGFSGDKQSYPLDKDILQSSLREKKICPGTLLVFTVFSFLNEFQCLGSFVQVEYLTRFKAMWQELNLMPHTIDHIPTDTLTTGMFPSHPQEQILDVLTDPSTLSITDATTLLDYYRPIWDNQEYYTNKQT